MHVNDRVGWSKLVDGIIESVASRGSHFSRNGRRRDVILQPACFVRRVVIETLSIDAILSDLSCSQSEAGGHLFHSNRTIWWDEKPLKVAVEARVGCRHKTTANGRRCHGHESINQIKHFDIHTHMAS